MNVLLFAIPGFFLLILIELFVDYKRNTGFYRINDAITSLNIGIVSRVNGIFRALIPLAVYYTVEQNFALFDLPNTWWVWVFAFIANDFCYYWNHRMGHEINLLWASHVVHHSSEEYNLTTALRQTSSGILGWVFYLPLALLGVDVVMLATVGALNLVYQFWVHTRHVPKLGWYEKFFVTPSNHRVHHATNDIYLDRNYGGVFILWDRMFNTFQDELDDQPCMYGIRKPLASWNPLWANVHHYVQMVKDAWRAENWRDKFAIWFKPTGWRPADVAERYPLAKFNPQTFEKYDVKIPSYNAWYSLVQHVLLIVTVFTMMLNLGYLGVTEKLLWGSYIIVSAVVMGSILSGNRWAVWFEYSRHLVLSGLVVVFGYGGNYLSAAIVASAIGLVGALMLKPARVEVGSSSLSN